MKLLIVSDSHGDLAALCAAVRREKPDRIVHLGDYGDDARALGAQFPSIPLASVPGNCDGLCAAAHTLVETYEGVTVFMTHGHRYGVKRDLLHLSLAAREAGAQLALFGHTHVPLCEEDGGLTLVNPGACRGRAGRYAIAELRAGEVVEVRLCAAEPIRAY